MLGSLREKEELASNVTRTLSMFLVGLGHDTSSLPQGQEKLWLRVSPGTFALFCGLDPASALLQPCGSLVTDDRFPLSPRWDLPPTA